jgi:hypothetical protein
VGTLRHRPKLGRHPQLIRAVSIFPQPSSWLRFVGASSDLSSEAAIVGYGAQELATHWTTAREQLSHLQLAERHLHVPAGDLHITEVRRARAATGALPRRPHQHRVTNPSRATPSAGNQYLRLTSAGCPMTTLHALTPASRIDALANATLRSRHHPKGKGHR